MDFTLYWFMFPVSILVATCGDNSVIIGSGGVVSDIVTICEGFSARVASDGV